MTYLKKIYLSIENEQEPRKKLSPEVILAIQGLTDCYRAVHNEEFNAEIKQLYAKCEEKLGLINSKLP